MALTFKSSTLAIGLAFLPEGAIACADAIAMSNGALDDPQTFAILKPKQNSMNCRFEGFGIDGNYSGQQAFDLGEGKFGQVLVEKMECPYQEKLLFVDCSAAATISVDGVLDPKVQEELDRTGGFLLGGDFLVEFIQPPYGDVTLTKESTVQTISEAAVASDYSYSLDAVADFEGHNAEMAAHFIKYMTGDSEIETALRERAEDEVAMRSYDPYCGCKLFYPDSKGATQ